jgi:hypothetical protein
MLAEVMPALARILSITVSRGAAARTVAALATGVCLLTSLPAGSAAAATTLAPLTQPALSTILARGVQTRQVPPDLAPSLATAKNDVSLAWRLGCLLDHRATTSSKPCVFGDSNGSKTVVLFGDSHAAAWFSGLNLVSQQEHWRLVFLGKIGCPTADVLVKRINGAWYHSCITWRHNMERKIAALHPNLLVITSSDYVGRAQPDTGHHTTHHEKTWLNGVATTFRALRHAADHVAFIANVPRLRQPAYQCVPAHRSNVYPCTMARNQAFQWPNVRRRELQLAESDGIVGIDPAPWFCTATRCPVIANHILIFRDSQHITPEWSKFLAPMLADVLSPLISAPSEPA